jgi:heme exporter protein D
MSVSADCEAYGRTGASAAHTLADCFDLAGFFAMGGHGLYVWLCYGVALLVVLWLVYSVRLGERRLVRSQRAWARRHAAIAAAGAEPGLESGLQLGAHDRPGTEQGER